MKTALLLLGVLSAPLLAAEFTANNLFVADEATNLIHEFEPGGKLVRTFGAGSGLDGAMGIAFGPGGRLFVASRNNGKVDVFGALGNKVKEILVAGGAAEPVAVAFGPHGHLFVLDAAGERVYEIAPNGVEVRNFALAEGDVDRTGVAFGPDGHLLLPDATGDRVLEVDLSGMLIADHGEGSGLAAPGSVVVTPRGRLLVAAGDTIWLFNAEGLLVDSFGSAADGLVGADGLVVGPNGDVYVAASDAGAGRVVRYEIDGTLVGLIGGSAALERPSGMAFAPFRFLAKIKGSLARPGVPLTKIKEKSAVLSAAPGSRTLMVELTDDVTTQDDLASIFGASAIVVHGFEGVEKDKAKKRIFQGAQMGPGAFESGMATIMVQVKGSAKKASIFRVKSMKGTLQRTNGDSVYDATIKASKLLK